MMAVVIVKTTMQLNAITIKSKSKLILNSETKFGFLFFIHFKVNWYKKEMRFILFGEPQLFRDLCVLFVQMI